MLNTICGNSKDEKIMREGPFRASYNNMNLATKLKSFRTKNHK